MLLLKNSILVPVKSAGWSMLGYRQVLQPVTALRPEALQEAPKDSTFTTRLLAGSHHTGHEGTLAEALSPDRRVRKLRERRGGRRREVQREEGDWAQAAAHSPRSPLLSAVSHNPSLYLRADEMAKRQKH